MATASQAGRRQRARAGGTRTTAGVGASDGIAAEARDLVRQAAGDVVGKTVAAQIRQAARHLGYAGDDWRVREAWYGRAGAWGAAAVDELRQRFAALRQAGITAGDPSNLAQRVVEIRRLLTKLERQVAGLEAEVAGSMRAGECRESRGTSS